MNGNFVFDKCDVLQEHNPGINRDLPVYTECPRRNVPDFRRVFLMLKYTNITQNTYIQSWTVTEIMAREFWNFDSCYSFIDYQIPMYIYIYIYIYMIKYTSHASCAQWKPLRTQWSSVCCVTTFPCVLGSCVTRPTCHDVSMYIRLLCEIFHVSLRFHVG